MALTLTMLYLAHRDGMSIEGLAQEIGVPTPWLRERMESARLCYEHQVAFARN